MEDEPRLHAELLVEMQGCRVTGPDVTVKILKSLFNGEVKQMLHGEFSDAYSASVRFNAQIVPIHGRQ